MLPRVAVVGFGISVLAVIVMNQLVGLDLRTSVLCILLPTPMMLAVLCSSPIVARYADSKWTIKEKKIQMSDGFYIPAKRFQMWSYSVQDFEESEGYQIVTLKAQKGLSKSIVLNDSTLVSKLVDYLKTQGVNQ